MARGRDDGQGRPGSPRPCRALLETTLCSSHVTVLTLGTMIIYAPCDNCKTQGSNIVDGGASQAFDQRPIISADGCAFILDCGESCGAEPRAGSPYCRTHHALCRLPGGSARERRRLGEAEALAAAVGGRLGRPERLPPDPFLRRLENIARGFSRPICSRIVHGDDQ